MAEQQAALEKNNIFKNFISNPLGWLSTAIGVVGIILTVYFFTISREIAELCVGISSEKTIIFKKGENSKLKILYEGREISSDITSTQILLWNNGKKSIRPSNVLKPVSVVIPNCEILDAILIKESRPIINTKLETKYLSKGVLGLSWDILEKSDGCKIQLIYTAGQDAPINSSGAIEGQKNINTQKAKFLSLSKSIYRWGLFNYLSMAILLLICSITDIYAIKKMVQSGKLAPKKTQKKIMISVSLLALLFLIFMILDSLWKCLQFIPPLEWI